MYYPTSSELRRYTQSRAHSCPISLGIELSHMSHPLIQWLRGAKDDATWENLYQLQR